MTEADQREAERFRKLALPLLDEVYTFARYLTRDADEAEDAAQETYLRALRYFSGFSGELIKPWLFTILRNVLRSRDPRRFEPLPEGDGGEAGNLEPLWGEAEPDPEIPMPPAPTTRVFFVSSSAACRPFIERPSCSRSSTISAIARSPK